MKHLNLRYRQLSVTALEERVHVLEGRVTAIADAVRILAHGLEGRPTNGPGRTPAADAARRAYDLLLVAVPGQHETATQAAAGHPDT